MASRISQRSRRSSRSFSRLTWKRAMGIAAEARIATMATQMMSSTRVRPDSEWVGGTVWFGRFGMGEGGGREADFSATAAKAPPPVEMTCFELESDWGLGALEWDGSSRDERTSAAKAASKVS